MDSKSLLDVNWKRRISQANFIIITFIPKYRKKGLYSFKRGNSNEVYKSIKDFVFRLEWM